MLAEVAKCDECGEPLHSGKPGTRRCTHCVAGCGRCEQKSWIFCQSCLVRLHPERANDRHVDFDWALTMAQQEVGGEQYVDVDRTLGPFRARSGNHFWLFATDFGSVVVGPDGIAPFESIYG
jgi:hypothetical protein